MKKIDNAALEAVSERCSKADVLFIAPDGFKMAPARIRAYSFSKELNKRGVNAEVLSFVDDLTAPEGVPHITRANWPSMQRYMLSKTKQAYDIISKNKKAILYCQKADFNILAAGMAASENGNKTVLDYDDYDVGVMFMGTNLSEKVDAFHPQKIVENFGKKADLCVAASHHLLDFLHTFNTNTHLIPTVVDTQVFNINLRDSAKAPIEIDPSKINVLWPGTIWDRAMAEDVIIATNVFTRLSEQAQQKTVFHIVGLGDFWPKVKSFIMELKKREGLENLFQLHEAVSPNDMPALMANMDIGLISLHENSFTRCKSPTKMFEYMAMGMAVCSTNVGEPTHMIKDSENGYLAKDSLEFATKLEQLIMDTNTRKKLSSAGYNMIKQQYCMDVIGDKLESLLTPLLP